VRVIFDHMTSADWSNYLYDRCKLLMLVVDYMSSTVDLTGIEVIDADRRFIRQAHKDVELQAHNMLQQGIEAQVCDTRDTLRCMSHETFTLSRSSRALKLRSVTHEIHSGVCHTRHLHSRVCHQATYHCSSGL